MCDTNKTERENAQAEADKDIAKTNAPVEMFKALATFGFMAAVLCMGTSLAILWAPATKTDLQCFVIAVCGVAGLFIIGYVLVLCCSLSRKLRPSSKEAGKP